MSTLYLPLALFSCGLCCWISFVEHVTVERETSLPAETRGHTDLWNALVRMYVRFANIVVFSLLLWWIREWYGENTCQRVHVKNRKRTFTFWDHGTVFFFLIALEFLRNTITIITIYCTVYTYIEIIREGQSRRLKWLRAASIRVIRKFCNGGREFRLRLNSSGFKCEKWHSSGVKRVSSGDRHCQWSLSGRRLSKRWSSDISPLYNNIMTCFA